MFEKTKNIVITGGHFVQEGSSRVDSGYRAFEKLQNAVANNALHDSSTRFDAPKCHPNTRTSVINRITDWALAWDPNMPEPAKVLWLYGPAGSGKSAIAQTIAESLSTRTPKKLLACFFFSKSDPTRNNSAHFIATLAYQLAVNIPETRAAIEKAVITDPLIFSKSLQAQIQTLIVQPLHEFVTNGGGNTANYSLPGLVIIDGLDECKDILQQENILAALGQALHQNEIPLICLIASRPEQQIQLAFNSFDLLQQWISVVLDNRVEPNKDIRLYLTDSFQEIKKIHPLKAYIPPDWPDDSAIDTLVKKSSGQFIYAAVVTKFVSSWSHRPTQRLEIVLGLRASKSQDMPYAALDEIYRHLLSTSGTSEYLLPILATIILRWGRDLLTAADFEFFLGLEDGEVTIALSPLLSVATIEREVGLTHASLGDFLLDQSRSQDLHIDPMEYNLFLVKNCIRHIMSPISHFVELPEDLKVPALRARRYSFSHLTKHISAAGMNDTLFESLLQFSLPDVWRNYSPRLSKDFESARKDFIPLFLSFLRDKGSTSRRFSELFKHHVFSMDPIMKAEVSKYYSHPSLLTLIVIACTNKIPTFSWYFHRNQGAKFLLGLTKKAKALDDDTFRLFRSRSRWDARLCSFVFDSARAQEVFLDADRYVDAALNIFKYLSKTRRHPRSLFRGPADAHRQTGHAISNGRSRQRRVEKHQRGRLPLHGNSKHHNAYIQGLKVLPELLRRSGRSEKLIQVVHSQLYAVVIVKKWTRWTMKALTEYLDNNNS